MYVKNNTYIKHFYFLRIHTHIHMYITRIKIYMRMINSKLREVVIAREEEWDCLGIYNSLRYS